MTKMHLKLSTHSFFLSLLLLLLGCASGISQQSRSQVTYDGSFSDLQKTPREYVGEVVLLGGKIIENLSHP